MIALQIVIDTANHAQCILWSFGIFLVALACINTEFKEKFFPDIVGALTLASSAGFALYSIIILVIKNL